MTTHPDQFLPMIAFGRRTRLACSHLFHGLGYHDLLFASIKGQTGSDPYGHSGESRRHFLVVQESQHHDEDDQPEDEIDLVFGKPARNSREEKVPLPVVQKILGHSTPSLAASYVDFSDEEIREMARSFAEKEDRRKTSARNTFFGKIEAVYRGDVQTTVEMVSLGVDRFLSGAAIPSFRVKRAILMTGSSRNDLSLRSR